MASALDSLNKVQYVEQDFSTAVDGVTNFIQTNYPDEYNDYVNANLGQALIDIVAYAKQNLFWYLNRKVTDLYFPTSISPNAISKLARNLGYKAAGASASEATLVVSLDDGPYTFPVTISKGFQFSGPNNTVWEYTGVVDIVYAPGETSKTFVVKEGESKVANFVSTGEANQVFSLVGIDENKFVEDRSVEVLVDGVPWTEFDIIPFDAINAFETNLISNPATIKLGDSVQGNIPAAGAGIEIKYRVISGFRGRIISGGITEPVFGLVAQFEDIAITVTQADPSAGGEDPEDIREIVVNAPLFQQTQDRAVTKTDYDFLSNTYPNVARADAQIIRGISGDITLQTLFQLIRSDLDVMLDVSGCSVSSTQIVSGAAGEISGYLDIMYDYLSDTISDTCKSNTVQVSVLAKDSSRQYVSPTSLLLEDLRAYLQERSDAVHVVKTVDGISRVINVDVDVEVKAQFYAVEDDVVQGVEDAIVKSDVPPFGILVERDFNKSLYVWEIDQQIREFVDEANIQYVNIKIKGPQQYLDGDGNLICPEGHVLQRGTVNIIRIPRTQGV